MGTTTTTTMSSNAILTSTVESVVTTQPEVKSTTHLHQNDILLKTHNVSVHQSAVKIEETDKSTGATGVVVGVIVAILLFTCCVFGLYWVWRKRMGHKQNTFNKLPNISEVKEMLNPAADDQGEFLISYQSAMEAENDYSEGSRSESFTCEA